MSNQKRNNQDKFNFFVETELTKGKNDKGEDVIIIDGIASSSSVGDSDGETLYPSGYNLQPLLETGLINFNHQGSKDANANIGIPLEAKVINDGKDLYFKGMLWDCEQTRGIVRAYENFKKYSPNRKVGYSIEGKATMRGHHDKTHPLFKQVLAADVTGMAVTFSPKNKNTLLNIIKGEYSEAFTTDDEIVDNNEEQAATCPKCDHDQLVKGTCLSCGYQEKAITTETIAPATPEHVEGSTKNFVSNKNSTNFDKELKKSDIYTSISRKYPTATIAEKKEVYSFVEQVNTKFFKMAENKVSLDALNKAFSLLDEASSLVKSETTDTTLEKGEVDPAELEKALPTAEVIFKSGLDKVAAKDILVKGGMDENIFEAAWDKASFVAPIPEAAGEIIKSEQYTELVKSEISKSLEPVNEAIEKSLAGFGTLFQSIKDQNAELIKSNSELAERLEKLERTPATGRKSATNAAGLERFQKSEEVVMDENTFDISKSEDVSRLGERLFEEVMAKGGTADPLLEGTINQIEIHKTVPAFAYQRLAAMRIKLVDSTK